MMFIFFFDGFLCRDGMIKRPGNESYLRRLIEDERRAYSEEILPTP